MLGAFDKVVNNGWGAAKGVVTKLWPSALVTGGLVGVYSYKHSKKEGSDKIGSSFYKGAIHSQTGKYNITVVIEYTSATSRVPPKRNFP